MHDVAIVGAGPVGATLALALAGNDLDVVAIDGRPQGATLRQDRSLALSYGSRLSLERLGVWRELESTAGAVTPIVEIDVSQAGGFGTATLTAAMQSLPALGYVVSYVALQRALDAALARADVPVRFGTTASRVHGMPAHAEVTVTGDGAPLRARLAVVADGTGTAVDGIVRERHDYGQVAIVGDVFLDPPRPGVAYERFTPDGPVALLPERDHHALVWTMAPEIAEAMLALPERSFLDSLAHHFGARVTGFARIAGRRAFPLVLERARPVVTARAAVIGNAAQQLHPVAGQGFNLGLRDAWELAQAVLSTPREAIGGGAMLARYAAGRRVDRGAGIAFTHGLVRIFGNDIAIARWSRGLALALLDVLPPAKRAFTRAMLHGMH
jgi:2-octaprenyl-6-methoxyphenol hydroxylase